MGRGSIKRATYTVGCSAVIGKCAIGDSAGQVYLGHCAAGKGAITGKGAGCNGDRIRIGAVIQQEGPAIAARSRIVGAIAGIDGDAGLCRVETAAAAGGGIHGEVTVVKGMSATFCIDAATFADRCIPTKAAGSIIHICGVQVIDGCAVAERSRTSIVIAEAAIADPVRAAHKNIAEGRTVIPVDRAGIEGDAAGARGIAGNKGQPVK